MDNNKRDIDSEANYERLSREWVHTGQQIINLLEIASLYHQMLIFMDISPTTKEASKPDDKYGIPDKGPVNG